MSIGSAPILTEEKCDPCGPYGNGEPSVENELARRVEPVVPAYDVLTLGLPTFDAFFGASFFATSMLYELTGVRGSGRTQVTLHLAARASLPKEKGGLGGSCLYLDTRNAFNLERYHAVYGHVHGMHNRDARARPCTFHAGNGGDCTAAIGTTLHLHRFAGCATVDGDGSGSRLLACAVALDTLLQQYRDVRLLVLNELDIPKGDFLPRIPNASAAPPLLRCATPSQPTILSFLLTRLRSVAQHHKICVVVVSPMQPLTASHASLSTATWTHRYDACIWLRCVGRKRAGEAHSDATVAAEKETGVRSHAPSGVIWTVPPLRWLEVIRQPEMLPPIYGGVCVPTRGVSIQHYHARASMPDESARERMRTRGGEDAERQGVQYGRRTKLSHSKSIRTSPGGGMGASEEGGEDVMLVHAQRTCIPFSITSKGIEAAPYEETIPFS